MLQETEVLYKLHLHKSITAEINGRQDSVSAKSLQLASEQSDPKNECLSVVCGLFVARVMPESKGNLTRAVVCIHTNLIADVMKLRFT